MIGLKKCVGEEAVRDSFYKDMFQICHSYCDKVAVLSDKLFGTDLGFVEKKLATGLEYLLVPLLGNGDEEMGGVCNIMYSMWKYTHSIQAGGT